MKGLIGQKTIFRISLPDFARYPKILPDPARSCQILTDPARSRQICPDPHISGVLTSRIIFDLEPDFARSGTFARYLDIVTDLANCKIRQYLSISVRDKFESIFILSSSVAKAKCKSCS